jgi:hypothetical protein
MTSNKDFESRVLYIVDYVIPLISPRKNGPFKTLVNRYNSKLDRLVINDPDTKRKRKWIPKIASEIIFKY